LAALVVSTSEAAGIDEHDAAVDKPGDRALR
jgi:hypothetical protein